MPDLLEEDLDGGCSYDDIHMEDSQTYSVDNSTKYFKKNPYESSSYVTEHKIHYDIYYNELKLFYQKQTIFTSIQLGLFTGIVLKYDELSKLPWLMILSLFFLIAFSIFQLLISIRGNHVNDAVIETISDFEEQVGFSFLSTFQNHVRKKKRISKMNFPSLMIIGINLLFILTWCSITFIFFISLIPDNIVEGLNMSDICSSIGDFSPFINAIISCLFAITMKVADLLDEHGLKLFNHADIVFGILWGVLGAVLCLSNLVVANVIFAMMIGFVVRKRLDYINHIIAFLIISTVFLLCCTIIKPTYIVFLFSIIVLGTIKDLKYIKNTAKVFRYIEKIYLYVPLIYALPTFIYSIIYNDWIVFITFFTYDATYNIVRLIVKKANWYIE